MTRRAAALLLCLAATPAAAQGIGGTWLGTYLCAQGNTRLTLTVAPAGKDQLRALFHFGATPDNPGVPDGCYELTGRLDARTGELSLDPSFWIRQPDGYEMVGLQGRLDGDSFAGRIDHPSCTVFRLVRRSIPDAIAACRGAGQR